MYLNYGEGRKIFEFFTPPLDHLSSSDLLLEALAVKEKRGLASMP